jgi:hypothetical protein
VLSRLVCLVAGHRWAELGRWRVTYRRDRCERCGLTRQLRRNAAGKWELLKYERTGATDD